jgi:release factor glutamine methyltransferase
MHLSTPLWPDPLPENVYPPAEDTFILLDGLESDFEFITSRKPLFCLEIGCGSGVVINFFKRLFSSFPLECMATDINCEAALITSQTSSLNDVLSIFVEIFRIF